jgi:hypothetical protein
MRLVDQYIALYGVAILVSGLLLMAIGVQDIEVYYAVYLIDFLVAMELVVSFRRSLGRSLRPIILVFLLGFAYIVVQRVLQILG